MTVSLLEAALRASILVVAGLLAASGFRARSAAFRHWILAAAFLSAWATLPLSVLMPSSLRAPLVRTARVGTSTPAAVRAPDSSVEVTATIRAPLASPPRRIESRSVGLLGLLSWLWIAGTLATGATLIVGFVRLSRIAAGARVVDAPIWTTARDELQRAHGFPAGIRLLQSDHPSLLVTWGWRRPTIVLPASAQAWSADRARVVLAHECAHIERSDWLLQIVAELLRACCWFNPLIWMACRRLRNESERACDDVVLMQGVPAASYADHLLELTRRLHHISRAPLPALTMARRSGLEGRIVAMLNSSTNRRPVSSQARAITSAALVALTLAVAALHAQQSFYSLSGTVRDPSERVLPDTTLALTNADTGAKYEIRANPVGRFEFVGLPPASYTLTANRPGFSNLNETVKIAGNVTHDIVLKVGDLQESITVTARAAATPPTDAATLERRQAAKRRYEEMTAKTKAECAAGVDAVVGGSILPPAKLVDVRPVYPEHLKTAKIGGVVTMDAVIGTDGVVRQIDNIHGPDPALEQAAADAVRQWEFSTTLLNCQPIDVNMHVTTNFRVEP
jgi:beta-lactamase regulating signal transducer with metallopeptidase domain